MSPLFKIWQKSVVNSLHNLFVIWCESVPFLVHTCEETHKKWLQQSIVSFSPDNRIFRKKYTILNSLQSQNLPVTIILMQLGPVVFVNITYIWIL